MKRVRTFVGKFHIEQYDDGECTVSMVPMSPDEMDALVGIVRCKDCKHGHITIDGKSCKWCDLIATHDIDGNEPNNGYDPEPYFDADFFCAWGEPRKVDE